MENPSRLDNEVVHNDSEKGGEIDERNSRDHHAVVVGSERAVISVLLPAMHDIRLLHGVPIGAVSLDLTRYLWYNVVK